MLGIVTQMRSALPQEIEKMLLQNLISDSTHTLPHIHRYLEDMMQEMGVSATSAPTGWVTPVHMRLWFTAPELGHLLIDDNHDRPLHPLMGLFLRRYPSWFEDMTTTTTRWGISTPTCAIPEGWPAPCMNGRTITLWRTMIILVMLYQTSIYHRKRERFSTPQTARNPKKVDEIKFESENLQA